MVASLRRARALFAIVASLAPWNAAAEPENGWWWNPNESGRGFFIEATEGLIYLAGYFYESDGRATWLSSGGPNPDPYLYRGTLQTYRNGQALFGAYRLPTFVDVGPVEVKFTDDTHGTITWPGGTIPIERLVFGADDEEFPSEFLDLGIDPPFRPETGWWWNEAESGTGFSVEVQGPNAFVVAFMYDGAGDPLWYFSAGPMTSPERYEGDVLVFSGGQTLTGPYRPPSYGSIGRMTADFTATDEAEVTITDGQASKILAFGAYSKQSTGPKPQRPLLPRNFRRLFGPDDQWPQWVGTARQHYHDVTLAGSTGTATEDGIFEYTLNWVRLPQPATAKYLARYTLASTSRVRNDWTHVDTHTTCSDTGSEEVGGVEGTMTIKADLSYEIKVTVAHFNMDISSICIDQESSNYQRGVTGAGFTFNGKNRHILNMSSSQLAAPSTPPGIRVINIATFPSLVVRLDAKK